MYRTKMIATKDHFVIYIRSHEINDEMFSSSLRQGAAPPHSNNIMYWTSGTARLFINGASQGTWSKHADNIAPLGWVRSNHEETFEYTGGFGMANLHDANTSFTNIVSKEVYNSGAFEKFNNANTEELSTIDNNPNQTVVVAEQCNMNVKRDLDTFEVYHPAVEQTVTEEDLNIDWGGND